MQDTIHERAELEMDLRDALADEQFFLAYQPTLALSDMSATGVEALIRWKHPTRGILPPDEFIPLAEETGLISEIGALGPAAGVLTGRGVAQRPDIRSAWPSTSRRANSTATS